MKSPVASLPLLLLATLLSVGHSSAGRATDDRTITKVVKLLESMLASSKADGKNERTLYGKYKCYCDTNEAEKKKEIADTTEEIGLLENKIEDLQASNGKLSKEVAAAKADFDRKTQEKADAIALREKEAGEYADLKKDLEDSIKAMSDAIKTLAEVGADQTLQAAADHSQYMANYGQSLLKLKTTVKAALVAASAVVSKKQVQAVESFLQAPFTGTYTSQSGEVVGILKDMRDTFKSNLESATATEDKAITAHGKYIEAVDEDLKALDSTMTSKGEELSGNDSTLSTQRQLLETAQGTLSDAQTFLSDLITMCDAKAKDYAERTLLRTNEETAIAEAISILNSDAAFATFGNVKATKTGATSFVQMARVQSHGPADQAVRRQRATAFLRKAAQGHRSAFMTKAIALLQASNPFAVVLTEIQKMIDLIDKEGAADEEQFKWCTDERKTNNDNLETKKGEITALEGVITQITNTIEDPVTGLKALIQADEDALQANSESQKTQTKERTADNLAYQKNIEHLVEADQLLTKAVKVLKAYYSKILGDESAFVQSRNRQPTPPDTWDETYKGQSTKGTDAITMLEFILKNTKQEETDAHSAEKTAQHAFEDSMADLKKEEASLLKNLADLKLDLAKNEKDLLAKKEDLKATEKEKAAIEAYLLKIKPGCDFITDNLDTRNSNRADEKGALENAVTLLKESPAYIEAESAAHIESLGDCKDDCADSEEDVKCKACLAHVTIPAYCAGHPGTTGC